MRVFPPTAPALVCWSDQTTTDPACALPASITQSYAADNTFKRRQMHMRMGAAFVAQPVWPLDSLRPKGSLMISCVLGFGHAGANSAAVRPRQRR